MSARFLIKAGTLRVTQKDGKWEIHGTGAQTDDDVLLLAMDEPYRLDPNKDFELLRHLGVELVHPVQRYQVRWVCNADAETPVEAAMKCLRFIMDPQERSHVFSVVDGAGQIDRVDLDQLLDRYEQVHGQPEPEAASREV